MRFCAQMEMSPHRHIFSLSLLDVSEPDRGVVLAHFWAWQEDEKSMREEEKLHLQTASPTSEESTM